MGKKKPNKFTPHRGRFSKAFSSSAKGYVQKSGDSRQRSPKSSASLPAVSNACEKVNFTAVATTGADLETVQHQITPDLNQSLPQTTPAAKAAHTADPEAPKEQSPKDSYLETWCDLVKGFK